MLILVKDFYNFLISGTVSNQSIGIKKRFFLNLLILKGFVFLFFVLLNLFFFNLKIRTEPLVFDGDNFFKIFFNVVLLAPILEELIFRYHIKIQYNNIIFSFLASCLVFYDSILFLTVLTAYFIILLVFLRLNTKINPLILVYISAFIFGVSHVVYTDYSFTFEGVINLFFVFAPRFLSGLIFSYVFFKKGIISSIFLHLIWNFIPFLLVFLRAKFLEF